MQSNGILAPFHAKTDEPPGRYTLDKVLVKSGNKMI